jgi:cobalt-precorrin-7 (C5)-methyltransferase
MRVVKTIYIVGVGPGDPELITLKALKVIEKCEVVAGWKSVVDRFTLSGKKVVYLNYKDQDKQLEELALIAREKDVAILDHGDPSVSDFQFLERIKKACEKYDVKYEIIPGVSSVLRALHIVGSDLSQVVFITFHVRGEIDYSQIYEFIKYRGLLIIPEPYPCGVRRIAERLLKIGYNKEITVMERLTYQEEKIYKLLPEDIVKDDMKFSDLTIVYVPPLK